MSYIITLQFFLILVIGCNVAVKHFPNDTETNGDEDNEVNPQQIHGNGTHAAPLQEDVGTETSTPLEYGASGMSIPQEYGGPGISESQEYGEPDITASAEYGGLEISVPQEYEGSGMEATQEFGVARMEAPQEYAELGMEEPQEYGGSGMEASQEYAELGMEEPQEYGESGKEAPQEYGESGMEATQEYKRSGMEATQEYKGSGKEAAQEYGESGLEAPQEYGGSGMEEPQEYGGSRTEAVPGHEESIILTPRVNEATQFATCTRVETGEHDAAQSTAPPPESNSNNDTRQQAARRNDDQNWARLLNHPAIAIPPIELTQHRLLNLMVHNQPESVPPCQLNAAINHYAGLAQLLAFNFCVTPVIIVRETRSETGRLTEHSRLYLVPTSLYGGNPVPDQRFTYSSRAPENQSNNIDRTVENGAQTDADDQYTEMAASPPPPYHRRQNCFSPEKLVWRLMIIVVMILITIMYFETMTLSK